MANGNTTASRLGQINAAGDVDALFLKVFSGEILTTFEEMNVMKGLHTIRTISNGKSAQFPVTGIATAKYHTAGENIADAGNSYLSSVKHAEKVITIDDVLLASTFISNIDELKNHYDVRSIYAKELGKALAKRFDVATMKTLVAAARSTTTISGGKAGIGIDGGVAGAFTAAVIQEKLFEAAQKLDENDIPNDGQRYAILKPADYYKLLQSGEEVINRDFGGRGDVATGSLPMVAGMRIFKSNHLSDVAVLESSQDQDDDSSNNDVFGGNGTGYNGDLSKTFIIGGHPSSVGTVKLLDLATESDYKLELQGTLFVAKYAMGHGVLRPEAAFEIRDDS
tara:strand:+ start:1294 stop:2307 length:1014 start_codon:yes stop_codon:yes gene_type:complete